MLHTAVSHAYSLCLAPPGFNVDARMEQNISVWVLSIHVPLSTTKTLVLKLGLQVCLCASTLDQQLAGTNQTNTQQRKYPAFSSI